MWRINLIKIEWNIDDVTIIGLKIYWWYWRRKGINIKIINDHRIIIVIR